MKKEKTNFRVTLATPEDWEICKELRLTGIKTEKFFGLRKKHIRQSEAKSKEEWLEFFFNREKFTALCWNGSQAIGLGVAVKKAKKNYWFMRSGFVLKEFRGQGAGRKIFEFRLDEIKKRGGKKVRMGVNRKNARSINLAHSFGFRILNIWERLLLVDFRHPLGIWKTYVMERDL